MTRPMIRQLVLWSCGLALLPACQSARTVSRRSPSAEPPAVAVLAEKESSFEANSESVPSEDVAFEEADQNVQLTNFFEAPTPAAGIKTDGVVSSSEKLPPTPSAKLQPAPEPDSVPPQPRTDGMTVEDFEQLALRHNPAISQASASASKASAFREQVGLYPNPSVGYSGQQLADAGTDQHLAYVSQDIVTAHKLDLNRRVLGQEVQSQLWEVETQRYRVRTDVRQKFYAALAAQQRRDLADEFRKVAQEGVRIAELRRQALEGSTPEVLQSEIQLNEVELIHQRADYAYEAAWQELTAVAGVEGMAPVRLIGNLRVSSEPRNWDATYAHLIQNSPQVRAARARICRAIANMDRQDVQAIPNLQTMFSAGYDQGTDSGMINVQVGIPLPIYNQNEGNISAAYAEYCRATQDLRRIQLSIKQQLAEVARQYDSAAVTVHRYETQILPKAKETLDLSEKAYAAGEFDFLRVLVARRTFFDSNLEYNTALLELADAKWMIDGMLLKDGLADTPDTSMDDGLRGETLSGQ